MLTKEVYCKTFTEEKSKDAYLAACKWVANNVISKVEADNKVLWRIEKVKSPDPNFTTFKLCLYASLDEKKLNESFCTKCREYHSSFFINIQYACNTCTNKAFFMEMDQKLKIIKDYKQKKFEQY